MINHVSKYLKGAEVLASLLLLYISNCVFCKNLWDIGPIPYMYILFDQILIIPNKLIVK